jgi:hypothetical protein
MRTLSRSLLAIGAALGLAACGDDVSIVQPPPPDVIISGAPVTAIAVGATVQLSANQPVTWSENSAAISVDANGLVTAVAAGSGSVTATSTTDATKKASVTITVAATPAMTDLQVAPANVSIVSGGSSAISTVASLAAGATVAYVNTSNNTTICSDPADTPNPTITTVAAGGPGSCVITVTATATGTNLTPTTLVRTVTVTVTAQPVALTSLTVTPTNVNIGPGATQQVTTITQAVPGATITYANSSSNETVATVSLTGANPTITAVGNGTAVITITATGTAAGAQTNSISATVTVNVQAASVSINRVTACFVGPGFPPPPCVVGDIDITNTFGQIEVTLNINPGFQTLDSVRVKLGSNVGAAQGFTVSGAPTAPITLNINTASYTINAGAGTSTVRFPNGNTVIQAELFPRNATAPTASNTITVFLNNRDTYHALWTLPGGANAAIAANGLIWHGGPGSTFTFTAIPVLYSGNSMGTNGTGSATLRLTDWVTTNPGPTPVPPGSVAVPPFTPGGTVCTAVGADVTLPFSTTWGSGAAPTCAGVTNPFVTPAVVAALYDNGNPGPVATTVVPAPAGWVNFGNQNCVNPGGAACNGSILQPGAAFNGMPVAARIDVGSPTGVALAGAASPMNWANAGTNFAQTASLPGPTTPFQTVRGTDAAGPFGGAFGGVGLAAASTDMYQYADLPSLALQSFNPTAHAIPEDPADFSNRAYGAVLTVKDLLGNATAVGLSGTIRADNGGGACSSSATLSATASCAFGVDVTAPTVEYGGGLTPAISNMVNAVAPSRDSILHNAVANTQGLITAAGPTQALFGARYRDTRSGFGNILDPVPAGGIFQRIGRLGNGGTTVATGGVVTVCGSAGWAQFFGVVGLDDPTYLRDSLPVVGGLATSTPGLYSYATCARDRANNVSPVVTKMALVDITAPQITGLAIPAILTGGAQIAFTPTGLDDQEVNQGGLYFTYPNLAGISPSGAANRLFFPPFNADSSPGTLNFWYEGADLPIGSAVPSPNPARAGAFNGTICSPVGPAAPCGAPPKLTAPIGFLLGIDIAVGGVPPAAVSATYKPDSVGAMLFDAKRLEATLKGTSPDSSVFGADPVLTVPLLPGLIAAGTPFPAIGVGNWAVFGVGTPAGPTAQARATTNTSVTNPPFPQVAFFRYDATTPAAKGRWVHIGTVVANAPTNPTIFDQGGNRFWTYSLSPITPGLGTGQTIIAIGMSSTGNGLSTAAYLVP